MLRCKAPEGCAPAGSAASRAEWGRMTTFAEPMQKATVTLPATYLAYLKTLGEGNLSAGIRAAVDRLQEMD